MITLFILLNHTLWQEYIIMRCPWIHTILQGLDCHHSPCHIDHYIPPICCALKQQQKNLLAPQQFMIIFPHKIIASNNALIKLSSANTFNVRCIKVNVYSLISPWVQQTLQFTPLVLELSLIWSHLLWGKFSAFSAANAVHNFPIFRSTRYPSQLGGQR